MPTRAPSAASPVAVALPMPPVPPVTSTYLPAIEGASVMACSCLAAVGKLDNRSLVPGGQPGCAGAVAVRSARTSPAAASPRLSGTGDRKSTRLNSSHQIISYALFFFKKKKLIHFHDNPLSY